MNKINAFFDEIHDFQKFIVENKYLIGNYTIIAEQVKINEKNKKSFIDILAIDNNENRLTIIELKNDILSDKGLWQPIRYYDLLSRGEDSLNKICERINKKNVDLNPKVLIIVPSCTNQFLRSLSYFPSIDISVLEIKKEIKNSYVDVSKKYFYPKTIVHKEDLIEINEDQKINYGIEKYMTPFINKNKILFAEKIISRFVNKLSSKGIIVDVFYQKTKISIMNKKSPILTLNINKSIKKDNLELTFKSKNSNIKFNLSYLSGLEKMKKIGDDIVITVSSFTNIAELVNFIIE